MCNTKKCTTLLPSIIPVVSTVGVNICLENDYILKNINIDVNEGDCCSIVGASGSGKSTLLNIIGMLQKPSSGSLYVEGRNITHCSPAELAGLRNKTVGFVFQSFHLLPSMNIIENVALPLLYRGCSKEESMFLAEKALLNIKLLDKARRLPADLSGGQRQRIAIARALVTQPRLLLADEPTGNLDKSTAYEIIHLLLELHNKTNMAMVIVTHDIKIAGLMRRKLSLSDGELYE
ncbi:ABC transporter ATP-binding protein [Dickeya zeae]|uniref:ABC transporter ATP-binding protein n=1 Tax=Dickeya zeae TaxID=204042 RepID=UPI00206E327C|nr:ABC transporter ATP-binding protein [Dickeya zeae]UPT55537.1 ABC transporter ATP-binding protein [Dickeya zeae]